MYTSCGFVLAAVLALALVVAATPPACLIAAMGAQPNPADLTALCGTLEYSVAGNITELCSGSNEAAAASVYSASCLAKGMTVTVATASSSSISSHATKTGSASVTATGSTTGTAKNTGTSATVSGTGASNTASSTGSSASSSATGSSGVGANTCPQSAIVIGSLVLGLGFANYLL